MVPGNLVDDNELVLRPGDYYLLPDGLLMCCPGCAQRSGPRGKWTYDASTKTAMPSIHHDPAFGGCGWHGYLTNGVFISEELASIALEQRPLIKLIGLARSRVIREGDGLKKKVFQSKITGHYQLLCPGCKVFHAVAQGRLTNNDLERPTFSDSLGWTGPVEENGPAQYCHSYVEEGRIRFLKDSWHELRGTTVELPYVA